MFDLMSDGQELFTPGDHDSHAFRIPALLHTKKGTLIAAADARIASQRDNPNEIKNVIRRSFDEGNTWSACQTTVEFLGDTGLNGPAAIDCSLLQDQATERIWLLYSHSPGGVGAFSSWVGRGFDEQGRRILYNRHYYPYLLAKDGRVYTKDEEALTDYRVDQTGRVFKGAVALGTIYEKFDELKEQQLYEAPTSYLQIIYSDDEGSTWSKPIDLNLQVKEEWMSFIGTGPGIGIQLQKGAHQGRLVFPIYFMNASGFFSCSVIYSDDHGQTWQRGQSPNDNRPISLTQTTAETLGHALKKYELTESQVVEQLDGSVAIYMRNHYGKGCLAKAVSQDGAFSWGEITFEETLINPVCQFSLLHAIQGLDESVWVYLGPNDKKERKNGVLRVSLDAGKTWTYEQVIEEQSFIYSSMAALNDGKIGLLYESQYDEDGLIRLIFKTVDLKQLLPQA
ncbi:sialidase family protein [Enterococcus sp. LJL98]